MVRTTASGHRPAFVFLYAVCVMSAVAVLVAAAQGMMREPVDMSTRAALQDHALHAAMSGLNYGRHYISSLIRDINASQGAASPTNPVSLYFLEDWAGGPDEVECLNSSADTGYWTDFDYGSVCLDRTDNERARLSFRIRLNTNLIRNYWIYSWQPNPPRPQFTVCVPDDYDENEADPPSSILYNLTSIGIVSVRNPDTQAFSVAATKQMRLSFQIVNDNIDGIPPILELRLVTRNIEVTP